MSPERWRQVEEVFYGALDCEADRRAAFLDLACAGDDELRQEVELLLAAQKQAGGFLGTAALEVAVKSLAVERSTAIIADQTAVTESLPANGRDEPLIDQRIGPYELIRELGRGGMGAVYLAERADEQYHKQVAIKLLGRGSYDESLLRRFRTERQILAQLDHPHIARFLEGGVTEAGDPYFVMEYIEGAPLDDYCDGRKLSIAERLKLFRDVCSAAQYAHQNLIIHRDLKPSNIMVTKDGVVKLLDFGIAKLLESESFAETVEETATGTRLMTPQYASPEQARGEALGTLSDVYSLGVILYESLTGHRPYRLDSRMPDEVARIICEAEPIKPSSAVTREEEITTGGVTRRITPESVSAARGEQLEKLQRRLADDLDNIVLTALRKEPQRRYASVEQLSEDIRRYLEGRPVRARKDTLGYRATKFVKRHRAGVIAAGLIVLMLVTSVVGIAWQARVARAERAKAEQRFNDVRMLANSFMFEFHDAIQNLPGATPARHLVVKRALEYLDKLAQQSQGDPALQNELATAYVKVADVQGRPLFANLGDTEGALDNYRKAMAIREALAAADPANAPMRKDLAITYQRVGDTLWKMSNVPSAKEYHRKAQMILEPLAAQPGADWRIRQDLNLTYNRMGNFLVANNDYAGALEIYRKSLALTEQLAASDPANPQHRRSLVIAHTKVGNALSEWEPGDKSGALEHYQQALPIAQALSSADPTNAQARRDLSIVYGKLGMLKVHLGDVAGGMEIYMKGQRISEELSAADPQLKKPALPHGRATDTGFIMKTIAARMLDQLKIPYELRAYEVNEDELDAVTVAR